MQKFSNNEQEESGHQKSCCDVSV